jgi:phosphoserine phosphatase
MIRLVVFDVDGTIIEVESSWKYLHEKFYTWKEGKEYAEKFFQGIISYEEWARLDASLWRGITADRVHQIIKKIPYIKGAKETLTRLREEGLKVVLLSAGLSPIIERIIEDVEVDFFLANELVTKDGFLTGEVVVKVPFHDKDKILLDIIQKLDIEIGDCAAVGDDETQIPLFKMLRLGVAFNPTNQKVERCAHVVIKKDLRKVLPYLLQTNAAQNT